MSRSVLSIIGVVILALVVTACGDTPPPSSSGEPSEAPESQAAAESPGEEDQAARACDRSRLRRSVYLIR